MTSISATEPEDSVPPAATWPSGKRFAFTIVDDTDGATIANVGPVYGFLHDHGFLTTKTVWPLAPDGRAITGGSSLQDADYRTWILNLRQQGFEIALHGAADQTSPRARVRAALDYFREVIGNDPRLHANHVGQREGMYWGAARLDGLPAVVYRAAQLLRDRDGRYYGHDPRSELFWGDLCLSRIEYVRNFSFRDINTIRADPMMPYHDSRRPYARYWFSSSEGSVGPVFCGMISERNQDRLLDEGGACVMYTHLAHGFLEGRRLHPEFARLMKRLSRLAGWFVPASTILDHLRSRPSWREERDPARLQRMQWRWLLSKLRHGTS